MFPNLPTSQSVCFVHTNLSSYSSLEPTLHTQTHTHTQSYT